MSGDINAVYASPKVAKSIPCTLNKIFMESAIATHVPHLILFELLAFSNAPLF
jgi:hypothetical protein